MVFPTSFMALHPEFPAALYELLHPDFRWFPADETLRATAYADERATRCDFVFVDQAGFEKHPPTTFAGLAAVFTGYRPPA